MDEIKVFYSNNYGVLDCPDIDFSAVAVPGTTKIEISGLPFTLEKNHLMFALWEHP